MEAEEVIQGHIAGQLSEPRREPWVVVNFICQLGWATESSGISLNVILGVSLRVLLDGSNV